MTISIDIPRLLADLKAISSNMDMELHPTKADMHYLRDLCTRAHFALQQQAEEQRTSRAQLGNGFVQLGKVLLEQANA